MVTSEDRVARFSTVRDLSLSVSAVSPLALSCSRLLMSPLSFVALLLPCEDSRGRETETKILITIVISNKMSNSSGGGSWSGFFSLLWTFLKSWPRTEFLSTVGSEYGKIHRIQTDTSRAKSTGSRRIRRQNTLDPEGSEYGKKRWITMDPNTQNTPDPVGSKYGKIHRIPKDPSTAKYTGSEYGKIHQIPLDQRKAKYTVSQRIRFEYGNICTLDWIPTDPSTAKCTEYRQIRNNGYER